jgi:hypothetical protein
MTETRRRHYWSGGARAVFSGLAIGLTLLLSSSSARLAATPGIDPLEILQLQVRPNVMMVLDSSGSMGQGVNGDPDLSNEYPDTKIVIAKSVLNSFIPANQAKVSFMFGQYTQTDDLDLADQNRYMYGTLNAAAENISVTPNGNKDASGSAAKIRRSANNAAFEVTGQPSGTVFVLFAARFFNGHKIFVKASDGSYCGTGASVGTGGAVDDFGVTRAYVDIAQKTNCADAGDNGVNVRFFFYGVSRSTGTNGWQGIDATTTCGGFKMLTDMSACTDNTQFTAIADFLKPEMQFNGNQDALFFGNTTVEGPAIPLGASLATPIPAAPIAITGGGRNDPLRLGIRAGANTPIAETIKDFKAIFSGTGVNGDGQNLWFTGRPNVSAISAQTPVKQRTFAIVLTDGDDTCDTATTGNNGGSDDYPPLRAAYHAQLLYTKITAEAASGVPTFVIALGSGANPNRANWVAYGGSGMVRATTPFGADSRWQSGPSAAEIAACSTCRPALLASNAATLATALQAAIDQAVDSGEFSASASIVSTVFELTVDETATPAPVIESALDPTTRYNQRINILYQTTFELPLWKGRIYAFRNDGSFQAAPGVNSRGIWEAGETLHARVVEVMQAATRASRPANRFTFAELHANETVDTIGASGSALIKRRLFTSARNGVFPRTETGNPADSPEYDSSQSLGRNVVAMWPPNQTNLTSGVTQIDDANESVTGPLDEPLGIAALTGPELQTEFKACLRSTVAGNGPLLAACSGADPVGARRKEAREMLLAWAAGATVVMGPDALPLRTAAAEASPGQLLYEARTWLLLDATLAAPAVASPPLRFTPSAHVPEFILYRDGRRGPDGQGIPEVSKGYGLRNPDFDDLNAATKTTLKPVMSVVYVASNGMLHAFRAGPNCDGGTCPGTPPPGGVAEQGSEELWGFIPYDQLGKLRTLRATGQVKSPHTYMIGSSVRVASIFIPDPDGFEYNGAPYTGHWRTVVYFGRGPGGKYYTALDVTGPGAFTLKALETNPPWVLWSRGNVDTQTGVAVASGGVVNGTAGDELLYRDMGESWSVPAIGNVDPAAQCGTGNGSDFVSDGTTAEWRVFTGSGYGEDGTPEGKRFYQLDAISGRVCRSMLVPGAAPYHVAIPNNALVAGPSAYNPRAQDAPGTTTPDIRDLVTRVYFPDVQGRIWRYNTTSGNLLYDAGNSQPFGNSVALLKINNVPSIFANSGNDKRLADSDGPWNMYGIEDTADDATFTIPGTLISGFPIAFPGPAPSSVLFRGTTQPTTAFNASNQPRVFFAGTRFNPAGATDCLSSFDTILFAVSGNNGGAVYDFGGSAAADLFTIISGNKTTGIQAVGGSLLVGDSGSLASAPTPTPDPFPTPTPGAPKPAYILATNLKTQSPVCRSR